MITYIGQEGHLLYRKLIRTSMGMAGFECKKSDPRAVLVWYDDLRKKDFYGPLKPWQIVNRFPMINVICRKAPFVRLIQRTAPTFPTSFKFLPKSFLVPLQAKEFEEEVHKNKQRWIVKPDRGSLGAGIKIIEIGGIIPKIERLCVAQEYIPSFHIDGYKFDFRIYALVASVDPLRVYVYRNGVARFCSKKSGEKSVFAELTNKSLNKKNPDVIMTQIVKMIADVMTRLETEGYDVNRLWSRIDRAIVSTIITSTRFLKRGMEKQCPRIGYQRCFQILGFDVLLDEELNPYILEVNYRPSLETNADYERKMKSAMLADCMRIMAPAQELQDYVRDNYSDDLADRWDELIRTDPKLKKAIELTNKKHAQIGNVGNFVQAYPTANERLMKKWNRMIEYVGKMPTELRSRYFLPEMLKRAKKEPTTIDTSITELEDREALERQQALDEILDNETIAAAEQEDDETFAAIDEQERLAAEENDAKLKPKKSKKSSRKNSGRNSKKTSGKSSKKNSRKPSPGDEPVRVEVTKKKDDLIRKKTHPAKEVVEEDVHEKPPKRPAKKVGKKTKKD